VFLLILFLTVERENKYFYILYNKISKTSWKI